MPPRIERLSVDHLHQSDGWRSPAFLEIDAQGFITRVEDRRPDSWGSEPALHLSGFAIPGLCNVHSHAFQRALVGRTEANEPGREDSFWTWREEMYRLAQVFTPDALRAVAAQLYVEMLEAGLTSVGEFHYLHHRPDGGRYADPAEMSLAILQAAEQTGISLTMLPVLYLRGGFDRPASELQRPFLHRDVQDYLQLVERLRAERTRMSELRVGVAPHSLRAVPEAALLELAAGIAAIDPDAPVHLHIAEQNAEVEQCIAALGSRPIDWLIDHLPVDHRWCLVHATHADVGEREKIIASRAVVGLCPTTEANLGDGLFPARAFTGQGGRFGIGSDSQASVSAIEELRLLEYSQRLTEQRRNVLADPSHPLQRHVGRFLFDRALGGGAEALAQPVWAAMAGRRADLVVLDADHPRLTGHGPQTVLDAWILGGAEGAVRDVIAGGRHLVREGRHVDRAEIATRFRQAIAGLRG